jgi:hypothetical protein
MGGEPQLNLAQVANDEAESRSGNEPRADVGKAIQPGERLPFAGGQVL